MASKTFHLPSCITTKHLTLRSDCQLTHRCRHLEWNTTLIKQIFLHADTKTILSIPLSRRRPPNRLVWGYTLKGNFFVNSAYKVALSLASDTASGSTSNTQDQGLFWHMVRNLRIPNKVETFTWFGLHGITSLLIHATSTYY